MKVRRIISEHPEIFNDLYSYAKECAEGTASNNFLTILLETTCKTFEETVEYTIQWCNNLVQAISPIEVSLLKGYPAHDDLAIILRGYKEMLQGHMMFGKVSSRYRTDQSPFPDMLKDDGGNVKVVKTDNI